MRRRRRATGKARKQFWQQEYWNISMSKLISVTQPVERFSNAFFGLIGIAALCLLIPINPVFAAESTAASESTDTTQVVQQKHRAAAAGQKKSTIEKPIPKPSLPPLPSSVTPEQIKAFLSKQKRDNKDNFIILNFDNADLKDVITTVSSITGANFILSPRVEARVTIHSTKKIPTSEVLSVFESILEVNGMSLVKSGDFYKIVLSAAAKQKPIDVRKGKELKPAYGDRPITQIVPVEFVPVSEVSSVLKPMLSQYGSIIPNPRNSLLIINETASNLGRLLNVLKEIDVNAFQSTRMSFLRPKYSDVETLSNELTEVLNALNLGKEGVALVPIERINSLVVFSSSPSLLKAVEGWMKKLDEEVITGQNIFVYHVQNVKAESIAGILNTVYATKGKKPARRTPSPPVRRKGTRKPSPSTRQRVTTDYSRIEIAVFEPTNSLVILASPGIYRNMKETIKKLDLYPKEVLIEVIIAEVTLSDTDQFGIQWSALHNVSIDGDNFTGLVESATEPLLTASPSLGAGIGGLSYFLFKPDKLTALLHALASRGKVNILSSPRLLVRDQQEASIDVGEDIPTATGKTIDTATSSTTYNIEYKTVGIKLKIKPSINDEKTVVLDIEQEVSGTREDVTIAGSKYPAFTTRHTKTSVVVPDKQGIVIGGMMKERSEKVYQGVPILSAIPILGNLFRYSVDTRSKTELVILLTPHVVVNMTEADVLSMDFINKLKEVRKYLEKNEDQSDIIKNRPSPAPEEEQRLD